MEIWGVLWRSMRYHRERRSSGIFSHYCHLICEIYYRIIAEFCTFSHWRYSHFLYIFSAYECVLSAQCPEISTNCWHSDMLHHNLLARICDIYIYILSCINRYGPTPNSKNESPASALHIFFRWFHWNCWGFSFHQTIRISSRFHSLCLVHLILKSFHILKRTHETYTLSYSFRLESLIHTHKMYETIILSEQEKVAKKTESCQ